MTEWVDLTQPFDADAPHSAALPAPEFEQLATVPDDGVSAQWFGAPTHVGTHVDAPRHFVDGGATIDDLPPSRFTGTAAVLDLERDAAEGIDADAVAAAPGAADVAREEVTVALVRTGWGEKYGEDGYARYPWFEAGVGEWFRERDVTLLAVDTPSPDRPRAMRPDGWDAYPVHRTLLPAGVLIAEHLRIPPGLVGSRPEVFGFPVLLRGGDGAPARFVAWTA